MNAAKLVTAYCAVHPDPGEVAQRVSFGTSGHRRSPFTATFNEAAPVPSLPGERIVRASEKTGFKVARVRDSHGISGTLMDAARRSRYTQAMMSLKEHSAGSSPTWA